MLSHPQSWRARSTSMPHLQSAPFLIPLEVAAMAITAFPSEGSPDLALLNVARLFTRLEHNLLSPGPDRRSFQQSEYQRMRVNKVNISPTLGSRSFKILPGQIKSKPQI